MARSRARVKAQSRARVGYPRRKGWENLTLLEEEIHQVQAARKGGCHDEHHGELDTD